uniref:G-protein coupled receptors family 3 profile domain-containing protein n=1 Tax=Xenopus tropicalis TaxID=8364 RepID=A0A803JX18_XENTR
MRAGQAVTLPTLSPCLFHSIKLVADEYYMSLQALIFTVERINADPELLPNITLGFHIYDTCRTLQRAAQGTLLMLSGGKDITPNYQCHTVAPYAGVIGDSTSRRSILMAQILGLYRYPQVSYFATSPILSDRNQFPSFLRTIPSDEFQMKGLAQLVSYFGWSWLGILATDDEYGQFGLQIIKQEIAKAGACVAFAEYILTSKPDRNAPHLIQVIQMSTARVVVVISTSTDFAIVLEEMLKQNVTGYTWIGSEGWSTSDLLSNKRFQGILTGTVGFAIHQGQMPQFPQHLSSLSPLNDPYDTFMREYWEQTLKACTGNEKLASLIAGIDYRIAHTLYVAVYAIAWETSFLTNHLHFSHRDPDVHGPFFYLSSQLLHYVRNVNFVTSDGARVFFDEKGNPPAIYDIVNWRLSAKGSLEKVTVGSYDSSSPDGKTLKLNVSNIIWITQTQVPVSYCSPACPSGFRKLIVPGKPPCCYECARCPQGQISNQTGTGNIILSFLYNSSSYCPLGYSLAAITSFSTLTPITILGVFIYYRKTPIVRANNYSLSCLLLLSLFLCFLCSLGFIGYPQPEKCLLRQVAFGMVFALCISCVLAKTITVVIAFNATKPGSRLRKWTGVKVPYCVIVFCALIQLFLCVMWLILSPPFHEYDTDTKPGVLIVNCNEGSTTAFWCMLGYLGLLASISFIVAFLARRLPDSFNEAKLITFSMLAFLSVWVSFIPAYLSARGMYTVAMEVFAILSSSWAVVGCIFVPKCYIILFYMAYFCFWICTSFVA